MANQHTDYPYPQKGKRTAPDKRELRVFLRSALREGGSKAIPASAKKFARRLAASVMHYPKPRELPTWFRVLIQKKVSIEELAKTFRDRLHRGPTQEHQELALIVANEFARAKGGSQELAKHVTPELLARLGERGEKR